MRIRARSSFWEEKRTSLQMNRTTPDLIESVNETEIFVFGSNESGRHGKGAAKTALRFGAKLGIGNGISGNSYAIPTKNAKIRTLGQTKINKYVQEFIEYAKENKDKVFLVTEIGCGLAGYSPEDIAPMFEPTIDIENVHLPAKFWKILIPIKI